MTVTCRRAAQKIIMLVLLAWTSSDDSDSFSYLDCLRCLLLVFVYCLASFRSTLEIACFKDPTGTGLIDISRILTECLKLVLSPTLACLIIIKYGSLDV